MHIGSNKNDSKPNRTGVDPTILHPPPAIAKLVAKTTAKSRFRLSTVRSPCLTRSGNCLAARWAAGVSPAAFPFGSRLGASGGPALPPFGWG